MPNSQLSKVNTDSLSSCGNRSPSFVGADEAPDLHLGPHKNTCAFLTLKSGSEEQDAG